MLLQYVTCKLQHSIYFTLLHSCGILLVRFIVVGQMKTKCAPATNDVLVCPILVMSIWLLSLTHDMFAISCLFWLYCACTKNDGSPK